MKRILTSLLVATAALTAGAQHLPNSGFGQWNATSGYTYQSSGGALNAGTKAKGDAQRPGSEPTDWVGSSINQTVGMNKQETLITETTKNGKAVKMENKYVGVNLGIIKIGSNAPAFISFAKPWVYAVMTISDCDGGAYGGRQFGNYHPDAVRGLFKRTVGSEGNENAYIIAYLWNGTFKSEIKSDTKNDVRDDVDRAVMGRVSPTTGSTGQLVASCNYAFQTTTNNDWQEITVPLTYQAGQENATVEKCNVIISAADYWTRGNIKAGNTLECDDVDFVYYSDLSSLTYDGQALTLDGTAAQTFEMTQTTADYDQQKLAYQKHPVGGTVSVADMDADGNVVITVKGDDWTSDNQNQHVYTLHFAQPVTPDVPQGVATPYTNDLSVSINGQTTQPQTTTINYIEEADGSHSFELKNFCLGSGSDMIPVGNIYLRNLAVEGSKVTTTQGVMITAGDLEGVDASGWLGPQLSLMVDGGVPVVLDATLADGQMTASISIDLTDILGQQIKVTLAPTVNLTAGEAVQPGAGLHNVKLQRSLKAGWNTICLPFPWQAEAFGNAKVATFSAATDGTLSFTTQSEGTQLEANKPYVLMLSSALEDPVYFGVTVEQPAPEAVSQGGWSFVGCYQARASMEGFYGIATVDGVQKLRRGAAGSTLRSTGAYFEAPQSAQGEAMRLSLDGMATGLTTADLDEPQSPQPAYDLSGRRVAAPQRGLYIVGGRKVIR